MILPNLAPIPNIRLMVQILMYDWIAGIFVSYAWCLSGSPFRGVRINYICIELVLTWLNVVE